MRGGHDFTYFGGLGNVDNVSSGLGLQDVTFSVEVLFATAGPWKELYLLQPFQHAQDIDSIT